MRNEAATEAAAATEAVIAAETAVATTTAATTTVATANESAKPNAPLDCDIIGSFLRPSWLLEAREQRRGGAISQEELTALEDKAIVELVDKLVALRYGVVTDGEYRRGWYHSDFLASLGGVSFSTYTMNLFGEDTLVGSTTITSKIEWNPEHPFLEHFKFLKALADERGVVAKLDIPGPNMVLLDTLTTDQENFYGKDVRALAADFVNVYRAAIRSFYDAGCRYLQIDDPVWVSVCDAGFQKKIVEAGLEVDELKAIFLETAQAILADKPADLAITLHLCQGNLRSRKFYDATYENLADSAFTLPFDGFFLEYDDEKYCDFALLEQLHGQKVVLGVVSTRSSEIEDKQVLVDRVERAKRHYPVEKLCVATQCGFASTSEGNIITPEAQWEKLALLQEVADITLRA